MEVSTVAPTVTYMLLGFAFLFHKCCASSLGQITCFGQYQHLGLAPGYRHNYAINIRFQGFKGTSNPVRDRFLKKQKKPKVGHLKYDIEGWVALLCVDLIWDIFSNMHYLYFYKHILLKKAWLAVKVYEQSKS